MAEVTIIARRERGDLLVVVGTIAGVTVAAPKLDEAGSPVVDETGAVVTEDVPRPIVATGWVSAIEHHFGDEDYEEVADERTEKRPHGKRVPGRHLRETATARRMTAGEEAAYLARLVEDAHAAEGA